MTIDKIIQAIARINVARSDAEIAHGLQDRLYVKVLEAIAAGADDPAALAAEALKARDIEFARWTA